MKKIFIIFIFFNLFVTSAFAFDFNSNKIEIRSMLKQYNKALDSHDIEKVKTYFDEEYKSSDGFGLDEMVSMLQKTYDAYENIKYSSKITSINAYDNWALVQISDKTNAKLYPTQNKKIKNKKMGELEGTSVSNIYLKKVNNDWKIVYDEILMEETSLKYGIARKININLITPMNLKNGQEYDLSLQIDKPKNVFALASISREEISYPPSDCSEKYRALPQGGELQRVVKANNKNLDEYAIASVGFTKVLTNKEKTNIQIKVLGIAYVMKRINMNLIKRNSEILVKK